MFAAPTATQTVQDPVQAQNLAEPGVFDAFDRSGKGVAQRWRATILAGSSTQRKVVPRELEASRGSGKLSGAGEREQHLLHEAWHVVQQAQGRVQPTMQMNQGVPVNDDDGLEHEADVMGAKALNG